MPLMLHPHLKRGLQFEEHTANSQDSIEPLPRTYASVEEQNAKRRRIEKIALQYLRGKRPVILSAGLRGPFNHGWKNPWAQIAEIHGETVREEDGMKSHKIRLKRRSATQAARSSSGSRAAQRTISHSLASPRIPRAAQDDLEIHERSDFSVHTKDPPTTIPPPAESDATCATTFFTAEPGLCIQRRSSMTDPFWLQRSKTGMDFNSDAATSHSSDSSPIRTQKVAPMSTTTEFRIAAPAESFHHTLRDINRGPEGLRSGPSVAVVSPSSMEAVRGTSRAVHATTNSKADQLSTQINAFHPHVLASSEQMTETLRDASSETSACIVPDRRTATDSTNTITLSDPAVRPCTASGLREVTPQLKKLPASSDPTSTTSTIPHTQKTIQPGLRQAWQSRQPTLIASPAPNSSTGFKYRKVAASKWTISNAPRSKPRAVNFNATPASALVRASTKNSEIDDLQQLGNGEYPMEKAKQTQSKNASKQAEHQDEDSMTIQGSRTKSQTEFSTQAAILLAQLEFHENTVPQSLVNTPRLLERPHNTSSHDTELNESTTMTPHSFLRPEARPVQHRNSMTQGASMSTQDLFAAASPFAYSTIKKTVASQRVIGNNLTPCGKASIDTSSSGSAIASGEHIPKARRTSTATPWSFTFSDDSPNPESIPSCTAGATLGDDSLTHLNNHTIRDDLGHKEAIEMTDNSLYSYYGP